MIDIRRKPGESLAPPGSDCQRIDDDPTGRAHQWNLVVHGLVRLRLRWTCARCGLVVRLPGRWWPWQTDGMTYAGRAAHAALAGMNPAQWARHVASRQRDRGVR